MNGYIGYIRVSTVKQGIKGVSLQEQRDAILRYAERNQFTVTVWLEEMETAAKQGRPVFKQAFKLLRAGKARGIILHKLDRGARNLKDWAAIGELSDQGVEVHFVNESLDLQTRGGRLSADIQAVVAADYIRNLREETLKGIYGRLRQGLYPFRAPLGYLDQGKGKPKAIDPVMGPLVKRAFELYGVGHYTLETLEDELHRLGLRNRRGGRVTRNGLSTMLNNLFYIGIIRLKRTGESFPGVHESLIGKALFDRVQEVLSGKVNAKNQRHAFLYRRLLTCSSCGGSLTGERQKEHVYYRCHNKECIGTSLREEIITVKVKEFLKNFVFTADERRYFQLRIMEFRKTWVSQKEQDVRSTQLKLGQLKSRLNRLVDAYLDQALDKTIFAERKEDLLLEQKGLEETLKNLERTGDTSTPLSKFFELAGNASLSHAMANCEEKREILKILTSNRQAHGKNLYLEPSFPFREIANRLKNTKCDPYRDRPRTWDKILDTLSKLNASGKLPDLSKLFGCEKKDSKVDEET